MRPLPVMVCTAIAASFALTSIGAPAASAQGAPAASAATVHAARAIASGRHVHLPRTVTRAVTHPPQSGRALAQIQPQATAGTSALAVTAPNITVTYSGFPANAQTAFQAAVDIWKTKVTSVVPIHIDASWTDLTKYGPGVLASSGPTDFVANFQNAAKQNVYYPVALANAISGIDQEPVDTVGNTTGAEISADFNSAFANWYFGADGRPTISQEDLETVVLHELGHGLGFVGSFDGINANTGLDDGKGYYGLSGDGKEPTIFDTFATSSSGIPLTSTTFPSGSAALGSVLRGAGGGAHWGGAWGIRGTGRLMRPSLYSPGLWQSGSSFSHLDESTYPAASTNALMTPEVATGEADHDPGPIMLGMFRDMGWPTPCTAQVPAGSPTDTFHPVTPTRIYSTAGYAGRAIDVPAAGIAGVPLAGVDAVAVNVEVYRPTSSGYTEVLPGCSPFSASGPSSQSFDSGRTRLQLAVVRVNSEGGIRIWLTGGASLVDVDIAGWYGPSGGDRYHPVATQWLLKGGVTVKAGVPYDEPVLGHGGIPASGVDAVVLKAAVAKPTAAGWLIVSPGGLNTSTATSAFTPNQRISNLIMVQPGTGSSAGKIRLRLTAGTANVGFEVVGWYGPPGSTSGLVFHPGSGPVRVLSSPRTSQAIVNGLPASTPVLLNVSVGSPSAPGWLGMGPAGSLAVRGTQEFDAGHSISGLMAVDTSSSGGVRIHPSAGVAALYADRQGWFAAS